MKILGEKITNLSIIAFIIGIVIGAHMLCSCSHVSAKEAFDLMGAPVGHKATADVYGNRISEKQKIIHNPHESISQGRSSLGHGELDFLGENKFSPECCMHSSYGSSDGCACLTSEQTSILRGCSRV
jgi:hypothetical protein